MKNPLYTLYGGALLALLGGAQWFGFGGSPASEVKNVPKSIRENPGVYRSHYAFLPRWFGGK